MAPTRRFEVHLDPSRRRDRGSRAAGVAFVVILAGTAAFAGYLWFDGAGSIQHIRERSILAVPAAWVLSLKGVPDEAVVPLREALEEDPSPALRRACARALGTTRRRDVVAFLGEAATDDADPAVRLAAVVAMGENGESNAAPYLAVTLDDTDLEVEMATCRAIGALGLRQLVPRMIDKLHSTEVQLQIAARDGLVCFTAEGESYGFDPVRWHAWWRGE